MKSPQKRTVQGTPGSQTPAYIGKAPRRLPVVVAPSVVEPNNGQRYTLTELSKRKVD